MATTSTWSITYPTTANAITPLATHFANLASSTDSALTNVRNQSGRYTGTNAQRLALTAALGRTKGTEFYATDTDKNWLFDGTQWISSDPGMFVIVPAAAPSGFTVGADGAMTASNLSSGFRNFDNIFSGRFRNYRMETTLVKTVNNSTSTFAFRSGSSTISESNHFTTAMYILNSAAVQGGTAAGQTSLGAMIDDQGIYNYSITEIGSPFVAEPTSVFSQTIIRGGSLGVNYKTGNHEASTSLTGVSINFGQTVTSARIRFFGYA